MDWTWFLLPLLLLSLFASSGSCLCDSTGEEKIRRCLRSVLCGFIYRSRILGMGMGVGVGMKRCICSVYEGGTTTTTTI